MNIQFDKITVLDTENREVPCRVQAENKENSVKIRITLDKTAKLKEAVLFSGDHGFAPDTPFYGDGYQKLSQYRGTLENFDTFAGFTDKDHYKMPQTDGFKTVYNYALVGTGDTTVLIGAASCNRFRTEIRANATQMQIAQCFEGIEFSENTEIELEEMAIFKGEKNGILSQFADLICKNHPPKQYFEMPVGWCSWYCVGPNVSEKDIFKNLKVIKKKTPQLKYIQIDDGFQPFMGDWLETSDKFDRSMEEICTDIRKEGFEPAIWLAPFIASEKSRLLREHPEYFVQDENGKPLCTEGVTFRGWRDAPWYFLDGTNPAARQYIYDVVREIYTKWGVRYYKLDANVWGGLPFGVRYDKNATSVEAYRRGMETIFEATENKAFILGCNAPMWPSLGLVTGMRVTNDVLRFVKHMANLSEQCFSRNWMHHKLWVNDPDCLIMSGTKAAVMDPSGAFSSVSARGKFYKLNNVYIRASGGMVLSGDYVSLYSKTQTERLMRILDTDYQPAEFDDALEIGKKENKDGTEYFIFNRKTFMKKYEIRVPSGYVATDLYANKPLRVQNGMVRIYLTKNDCAWIGIKKA